ncbi:thioester domain-containing protein [Streptomyces sulphureus]|uniref:thioester domain-containing protein n=1 Tax=Streptomyces sulphureus TaxID=47758 RepID=UPI001FE0FD33|nr:thioester domain-containing protein [Streptomyces sulphureus]
MTSARRRPLDRRAAVAVVSGALFVSGVAAASPAAAGQGEGNPRGATASLDGLNTYGKAVVQEEGGGRDISAGLSEMTVEDGGSLQSYSVDMLNPTREQAGYEEASWGTSSLHHNKEAGKIRWIVENSFPQVNDLQALARQAKVKRLTPELAAAGTQVAIWRLSEESTGDGAKVKAAEPAARKLTDYLVNAAKPMPEPRPSLQLGPAETAGMSGDRLGPVTVRTTAPVVSIEADPDAVARGVRLVDKKGDDVETASNGTKVYFEVPEGSEGGTASLLAQASAKVPVGRVFTGTGEHARTQTQILAGASSSTVSGSASVSWAEEGPVAAVSSAKNCDESGVDITVANGGDEEFDFTVGEHEYVREPGESRTETVPVEEDQPYRIAVNAPDGADRVFTGVLDCATASAVRAQEDKGLAASAATPSPATVGGGGLSPDGASSDLAETGSSDTPLLVSIAVGLVVVGGTALMIVRRARQ